MDRGGEPHAGLVVTGGRQGFGWVRTGFHDEPIDERPHFSALFVRPVVVTATAARLCEILFGALSRA